MSQKKLTYHILRTYYDQLKATKTVEDVARLLKVDRKKLLLMSESPLYYHFSLPKKSGGMRDIEAPDSALKKIQRKLNTYLQAYYFLHQREAAYGYIPKVYGSKIDKSIRTNAEQHLGNSNVVNIDFSDFFHRISQGQVLQIFTQMGLESFASHVLSKICTYKGRLPMGAPTSPALSNIYCMQLDDDLMAWAKKHTVRYTRYVDDMSFSSDTPIGTHLLHEIQDIVERHNLLINTTKTRIYGKNDTKVVTGLVLNETVDLPDGYYDSIQVDLNRLRAVIETQIITGALGNQTMIRAYKKEVAGKINFIAMIEGYESPHYIDYLNAYHDALSPPVTLSLRWTQFSNYW